MGIGRMTLWFILLLLLITEKLLCKRGRIQFGAVVRLFNHINQNIFSKMCAESEEFHFNAQTRGLFATCDVMR
jgi:hypothetical protein